MNQVNVIRSTAGHGLVGGPEAANEAHKGRERWVSWVSGGKNVLWGHRKGGNDVNRGKPT